MSFRTSCPVVSSAFRLVTDSLLQAESLPFDDALAAEHIEQAFAAEGVSFAYEGGSGNEPVYTPAVTLWAMLSQALFTGEQRSCTAAVIRVAMYYALLGRTVSSTNTGAYSRARDQVTEEIVRRLTEGVAERCEAAAPREWRWLGRTVHMVDGTTHSMPDTPENQAAYLTPFPKPPDPYPEIRVPLSSAPSALSADQNLVTTLEPSPLRELRFLLFENVLV